MAVIKSKVFTFNAGWSFIAAKPEKLEEAINDFIERNGLNNKEIINVSQSESDGKLFTLTFIFKEQ